MINSLPKIPTAISRVEAEELERLAYMRRVVEVGSGLGFSTIVMARVARWVGSVDHHRGYKHNYRRSFNPFMNNLDKYNLLRKVDVIVDDSRAVKGIIGDFAFIDLDGSDFALIKQTINIVYPTLIAVHDLHRNGCKAVEWAIDSLIDERKIKVLTCVDQLIVLEKERHGQTKW